MTEESIYLERLANALEKVANELREIKEELRVMNNANR